MRRRSFTACLYSCNKTLCCAFDEPLDYCSEEYINKFIEVINTIKEGRIILISTGLLEISKRISEDTLVLNNGEFNHIDKKTMEIPEIRKAVLDILGRQTMRLFRKLFAEKILRFYEGTNAGIRYISNAPLIGRCVKENTFAENSKARLFVGIMAQLFMVLWEFIKKFAYVFILIYIPYVLIGLECPLIKANQELTIIYMFVMLSVICGSLSNNILFTIGDRDYLMIRVMSISPYMNF